MLDYSSAEVPVRDDLRQAQAFLLEHIASPGTWWTGAERVEIAAESRRALDCPLCLERKGALSPAQVQVTHASSGMLPEAAVEVIHRVRSDPARLSRKWFEEQMSSPELPVERYVEGVGVVSLLAGLDYFCRALGIPPFALPEPRAGEPTRQRPERTQSGIAWVPILVPEDLAPPEADLYGGRDGVPNIVRALSLVPDQVRALRRSSDGHYVPMEKLGDPSHGRDLDRMQMELVAARVSALNECFY